MKDYRRRATASTPRRKPRLRQIPIGPYFGCRITETPTPELDRLLNDRRLREPWRNAVLLEACRRRLPALLPASLRSLPGSMISATTATSTRTCSHG